MIMSILNIFDLINYLNYFCCNYAVYQSGFCIYTKKYAIDTPTHFVGYVCDRGHEQWDFLSA